MSREKFIGWQTIWGGDHGARTPYMTRAWIGRLRIHIFHRGDADPDCHDHPWDFWTFPLTPYVEEVVVNGTGGRARIVDIVPAFRWSFRPATHTHRVLGIWNRKSSLSYTEGKIVTIVWRSAWRREWGFTKIGRGTSCWIHWKDYIFGGGKDAPCGENDADRS